MIRVGCKVESYTDVEGEDIVVIDKAVNKQTTKGKKHSQPRVKGNNGDEIRIAFSTQPKINCNRRPKSAENWIQQKTEPCSLEKEETGPDHIAKVNSVH